MSPNYYKVAPKMSPLWLLASVLMSVDIGSFQILFASSSTETIHWRQSLVWGQFVVSVQSWDHPVSLVNYSLVTRWHHCVNYSLVTRWHHCVNYSLVTRCVCLLLDYWKSEVIFAQRHLICDRYWSICRKITGEYNYLWTQRSLKPNDKK